MSFSNRPRNSRNTGPGKSRDSGPPREPRPTPGFHTFKRSPASKRVSGGKIPSELTDAARGVRLQKVIAEAGVTSRRDAELLIAQGRVTVNGEQVTALPAWVDPFHDHIEVNGQPIPRPRKEKNLKTGAPAHVYVILNKPRNVISTARDEAGRTGVVDFVDIPKELAARVFPVGRLDADSTGLILLTNDGELANHITHPRYGVSKEYIVTIRGHLTEADVEKLKKGMFLAPPKLPRPLPPKPARAQEGQNAPEVRAKKASVTEVKIVKHERDELRGDRTKVWLTLGEGQNREIRRLMARLGYNVRRLQRVAIGPITLKGLANGEWRLLLPNEVKKLRRAAGL